MQVSGCHIALFSTVLFIVLGISATAEYCCGFSSCVFIFSSFIHSAASRCLACPLSQVLLLRCLQYLFRGRFITQYSVDESSVGNVQVVVEALMTTAESDARKVYRT